MKYIQITFALLYLLSMPISAQEKFLTKNGFISFFSSTPIEDIKAENNQILSIIDANENSVAIVALMKSFKFKKSLMQEHFNENYVESDKYPKATFKGKIEAVDVTSTAKQDIQIQGQLTIHGVTKPITTTATIQNMDGAVHLKGSFSVDLVDYKIKIPKVVMFNIAESVLISFDLKHEPYLK